jgi:ABC-type enterochelin transport system ATPase subunit
LVQPLKQLALHKLQQTLVTYRIFEARIQDLVALVRFAYSDDNTSSEGGDQLRALVTIYMAARAHFMDRSDAFLDLLEEGGQFVRKFWMIVRRCQKRPSVDLDEMARPF